MRTSRFTALLTLLFLAVTSHGAWACAACYDAAGNEKMTKAASIGIGVMVVIMLAMLGSLVAFGRHLYWRSKNPLPDYDELLAEDPKSGDSNPQT
jgi:hypothetical protein